MTNLDEALLRHLLAERQVLDDMLALADGDEIPPERRARLRTALRGARRRTLTFVRFAPGVYFIDGRRFDSTLLGVRAAWLAFRAPGRGAARVADLAAPGSSAPARVVRKALRLAADRLRGVDPALAAEIDGMRIAAGCVRYDPRPSRQVDVVAVAPQVLSRSPNA